MKSHNLYIITLVCFCLFSCKDAFLDAKPDKALLVPKTLDDMQALLDNTSVMNTCPSLSMISTDDFYYTDAGWKGNNSPVERNAYIWADDLYQGALINSDWDFAYRQVFYANVVLEGLQALPGETATARYKQIKGSALFFRAMAFYNLAQMFARPYDESTASSDLGLPLHLTADVNDQVQRSSVKATYDQILKDLKEAAPLLPSQQAFKNRPSSTAANALLARVYQTMQMYEESLHYADLSLAANKKLLNFYQLNATAASPFPQALPNGNDEVIFFDMPIGYTFFSNSTLVDTSLYQSYGANDLRPVLFFRNVSPGAYAPLTGKNYTGMTTAEMYLIRAEAYARKGAAANALKDLNDLLVTRYKSGTYTPIASNDAAEVLKIVLRERRKELIGKGVRWADLRRLNKDQRFATKLVRKVDGKTYELSPGSDKFVFPIPESEISRSGIAQNPR